MLLHQNNAAPVEYLHCIHEAALDADMGTNSGPASGFQGYFIFCHLVQTRTFPKALFFTSNFNYVTKHQFSFSQCHSHVKNLAPMGLVIFKLARTTWKYFTSHLQSNL